jgi:N-acetylneuraminate lyase
MNTNLLKGLYPAMITPFLPDEKIDEKGLEALAGRLISQGADGLYVCGSSGEGHLMSLEERKKVLEIVLEAVGNRCPVVAHIGCQRTADAVELARHAHMKGAAAISALPPVFYRYTVDELSAYYLEIMDAVPLPFIVYNAPALTGIFFDHENIARVFNHPNAYGMKYTSYDSYRMQRLMSRYPDKVMINGHDETYLGSLALGVKCAIGSTLNFSIGNFKKIDAYFESGRLDAARLEQDTVNRIVDTLMQVGVFRGLKGVLRLLGLPAGNCRRPFAPLKTEELHLLEKLLPLIAES